MESAIIRYTPLQSTPDLGVFVPHLFDGGLDVLVAGGLLQPAGEVYHRNVSGRHSERHARQLAVELGDNLEEAALTCDTPE